MIFICYGTIGESFSKQVALEMSLEEWIMIITTVICGVQEGGKGGDIEVTHV